MSALKFCLCMVAAMVCAVAITEVTGASDGAAVLIGLPLGVVGALLGVRWADL